MTATYKQKLSPWEVLQLDSRGKWLLVSAFRSRNDADAYAKILRLSSNNLVEVAFNYD